MCAFSDSYESTMSQPKCAKDSSAKIQHCAFRYMSSQIDGISQQKLCNICLIAVSYHNTSWLKTCTMSDYVSSTSPAA